MHDSSEYSRTTGREYYTLTDFLAYLWKRRTILALINVFGILLTLIAIGMMQPNYTASLIVAPESNDSQTSLGGLAQLAKQYAGNLGGLGVGGGSPDQFNDFIALYRSPEIVKIVDQKYQLRQKIFSRDWNAKEKRWSTFPHGIKGYISASLRWLLNKPSSPEPTYSSTSNWLVQNVAITFDQNSSQWTIAIDNPDREKARWLLQTLYNATEGYLRATMKAQTLSQVDYLNRRLSQITVADYRQALLDVLATQEKSLMLLESTAPVAARIVVPTTVTDEPTSPVIALDLAIGILISIIASIVIVVSIDWRLSVSKAISVAPTPDAEVAVNSWLWEQMRRLRTYVSRRLQSR